MYQWIHMDAQDDIYAAKCLWCLLMHTLCLDAPKQLYGWSRWPFMHLDVFDVYCCRSCVLMHQGTYIYGYSRWPSMLVDVLVAYSCTSCVLMHQGIYMDAQDDTWCSWMSWMSIDAQVVPWCTNTFYWMPKMTLNTAGCLGCLSLHKFWLDASRYLGCLLLHILCLDASRDLYECSRWPLM